jgi:hypothetical protein
MVQTSTPLGWPNLQVWAQWDCPPLFLWQREGFQEQAVDLSLPIALVGRQLESRSLHN